MEEILVEKCPICRSEEEEIIDLILGIAQIKKYQKNVPIFEQGDESKGLYLITSGRVKVSNINSSGKEVVLALLRDGHTFGENSLFSEEINKNTTTALEKTEIIFLPKSDLKKILEIAPKCYDAILQLLFKWMNNLNEIIETISTPSAVDRVKRYLLKLKEDQGGNEIELEGKKFEVALMLGLRPETFSRALSDLEENKMIKMNNKQITLLSL